MKACELVGVSRRTIYNWLSSGKIEYVRTAGGSVRIFVDTLWRDPQRRDRPAVQAMWQAEGEPGLMPVRSASRNCSRGVRWTNRPSCGSSSTG